MLRGISLSIWLTPPTNDESALTFVGIGVSSTKFAPSTRRDLATDHFRFNLIEKRTNVLRAHSLVRGRNSLLPLEQGIQEFTPNLLICHAINLPRSRKRGKSGEIFKIPCQQGIAAGESMDFHASRGLIEGGLIEVSRCLPAGLFHVKQNTNVTSLGYPECCRPGCFT
jgi:hypothetical protein